MSATEWVEQILALPDTAARRRLVEQHASELDDDVAIRLKEQADRFLESEVQRSLEIAELLVLASKSTSNPLFSALGLLAEANARSIGGLGEYSRAIELYERAADIYLDRGDLMNGAKAQVGKVFSLAMLGQYDQALAIGREAATILEMHHQWRPLINLTINLAIVYGRQREDLRSLAEFDRARALGHHLNSEGKGLLALVESNRAIVLRNLGQFDDSIDASRAAWEIHRQLGAKAAQGHVQLDLASTYMFLGRTNEALKLLHDARDAFLQDGRPSDALEADLGIGHCLLRLRRFYDALETCQEVRSMFGDAGRRREVAEAAMVAAAAYTGLHRFAEAQEAVQEARRLFEAEGNEVWIARVDLEAASLYYQQGQFEASLTVANSCTDVFRFRDLGVQEAQARLIAARSAAALGRRQEAQEYVGAALAVGEAKGLADLVYPCCHLLGLMSEAEARPSDALAHYDRAIKALERLRGRLMVEFRADFLQDKQAVYEDVVRLCLAENQPGLGLEYAERAKSRALLDLVAFRLDLSVQVRGSDDGPLVDELTHLRAERDRLVRRWEGERDLAHGGWVTSSSLPLQPKQDLVALEKQITDLWHKLLIRNADYAREASLWEVRAEPIQPYLPADTTLLEYFVVRDQLIAFVVTRDSLHARPLGVDLAHVQQMLQMLQLNLKTLPRSRPEMASSLIQNANGVLTQLYRQLMAPVADLLTSASHLVIVPHGALHYLPFHALRREQSYLIEQYEISYLPGASLLRFCAEPRRNGSGLLTVGHSYNGQLPFAAQEARSIADAFHGEALIEDLATPRRLTELAPTYRTIHLAAHGDFRPDNPLFSGLALEDGWLTTFDIFNLRLNASLVTLSACQTGRNVNSGGDELLGLMRAFLYAGAASLVLSLWPVEDRSTARLMEAFYAGLADGRSKAAALRQAQLQFIHQQAGQEHLSELYAHPYFWAPFFLVGDGGPL